jgi:nucleoid-associated protein YgaU
MATTSTGDASRSMAVLAEEGGSGTSVTFQYNPTSVSFTRAVKFSRDEKQQNDPAAQFTGAGPTQLTLQVFLDGYGDERRRKDMQEKIDQLIAWTTVPNVTEAGKGPPRLVFAWGDLAFNKERGLVGHLEQLKVTYELFDRAGRPLRATADLTFKSAQKPPAGTNPTSGAERSRRRHVLRREETLHGLAHETFGDAGAWRAIAELNGIDDPLRVLPGRELLLPDPGELSGVLR